MIKANDLKRKVKEAIFEYLRDNSNDVESYVEEKIAEDAQDDYTERVAEAMGSDARDLVDEAIDEIEEKA